MADFREDQRFQPRRTRLLLASMPAFLTGVAVYQIAFHHPWGAHPMSNGALIFWCVFLWLIYWRLATVRLVTVVEAGTLSVGLHGLWPARRVPISNVKHAKVVKIDPIRDFGGYGIRSTKFGKAYVSQGTSAVRVELKDEDVLIIGSGRAEELARLVSRGS